MKRIMIVLLCIAFCFETLKAQPVIEKLKT
jgi:hypothetical protein